MHDDAEVADSVAPPGDIDSASSVPGSAQATDHHLWGPPPSSTAHGMPTPVVAAPAVATNSAGATEVQTAVGNSLPPTAATRLLVVEAQEELRAWRERAMRAEHDLQKFHGQEAASSGREEIDAVRSASRELEECVEFPPA